MKNAKTGLRLISGAIILNAIWSIVFGILSTAKPDSTIVAKSVLITSIVSLVCYVIELIGLFKAGKDNARFHFAAKLKITNIAIAVIQIIISSIVSAVSLSEGAANAIAIVLLVLSILSLVFELLVLYSIIKGCKEIAPRVEGLAKFVMGSFIGEILLLAVSYILLTFFPNNNTMVLVAGIFALIASLIIIAFAICYLILIFRTTANVGKARK